MDVMTILAEVGFAHCQHFFSFQFPFLLEANLRKGIERIVLGAS